MMTRACIVCVLLARYMGYNQPPRPAPGGAGGQRSVTLPSQTAARTAPSHQRKPPTITLTDDFLDTLVFGGDPGPAAETVVPTSTHNYSPGQAARKDPLVPQKSVTFKVTYEPESDEVGATANDTELQPLKGRGHSRSKSVPVACTDTSYKDAMQLMRRFSPPPRRRAYRSTDDLSSLG
jgi:hypothetical protein